MLQKKIHLKWVILYTFIQRNKERGWPNTHWYTNILLKNDVINSEETFIYEERHSIDKSLFSEVSSSSSLKSPIDVLEKLTRFPKLMTSENTFWSSLCEMVVCKVLTSKIKMDLAFFQIMTFFSLVTMEKNFAQTRISYSLNKKKKLSTILKIVLKILCIASACHFELQHIYKVLKEVKTVLKNVLRYIS